MHKVRSFSDHNLSDVDKVDDDDPNLLDFKPPLINEVVDNFNAAYFKPDPLIIKKSQSQDSNNEGSAISDIQNHDFSIQVTSATVVEPETAKLSYLSMISPMQQGYAVFTIETRSRMPMY